MMEIIDTTKGKILLLNDKNIRFDSADSFLEILFSASTDTLVISKENLTESFFELKTGIAGEILQKFSNYKIRLVIIGDFKNLKSKSLNDFIYESNKNGKVIFTDELNKAIEMLR